MQRVPGSWIEESDIESPECFQEPESKGFRLNYKYAGHWNEAEYAAAAKLICGYLSRTKSH